MLPGANLVFTDQATRGAGERMYLRVVQANMHVLVHLDAKFRIRQISLGKFRRRPKFSVRLVAG